MATLLPDRCASQLQALTLKGRRRTLAAQAGLDFSSNDYLGLASSPDLAAAAADALARGVPVGAGGSRLLRGNHPEHEALEAEAAIHFGTHRMLYFGGGYQANLALFSALPQAGDLVIHDALIHASVHAGLSGSRARVLAFAHNDATAADDALRQWRADGGRGQAFLAVESIYSMDGDCAPLTDLVDIAIRHDATLVIDEAHATGVHGTGGRGFATGLDGRASIITLHTCGKALGGVGALVGADPAVCEFLVNRARPFIYSTAPSPLQAAIVRTALHLAANPERRASLAARIAFANRQIADRLQQATSGSQIIPILIGDNARAARVAATLQDQGFDIRAIRPPTVPAGTARLRISITMNTTMDDISCMTSAVALAMSEVPA